MAAPKAERKASGGKIATFAAGAEGLVTGAVRILALRATPGALGRCERRGDRGPDFQVFAGPDGIRGHLDEDA